ncbi:MAG: outer membrane beta-barrel protein [Planctomycetia bacterium]|nr:outer membrane beta-barrel protein [Planctomycetia bacterium]
MKQTIFKTLVLLTACLVSGAAWGADSCATCTVGGVPSFSTSGSGADVPYTATTDNGVAGVPCTSCESIGDPCGTQCRRGANWNNLLCGVQYNGYMNAGGMFNTRGAKYNVNHAGSDNEVGFDGAYLSVFKKAQTGCGCTDWGFGMDTMFGRDARFFSSYTGWDSEWETGKRSSNFNNWQTLTDAERESYGFAMPQMYGEVSLNNTVVKMGRFYTLMGYEGARADQRFFYGFGRNFEVTPITHTGAIASWKGIENMDIDMGWVAGENNMFEREYDESLVTGRVRLNGDYMTLGYAFVAGDGAVNGVAGDLFRNNIVWTAKLGCRLETALIYNYGSFDSETACAGGNITGNICDIMKFAGTDNVKYQTWAGYTYYTLNDCWKLGGRLEWQQGSTWTPGIDNVGADYDVETWNMGLGAHWTPCGDNFTFRPEIRYDKASAQIFGLNHGHDEQISLAFDVLYKF